MVRQLVRSLVLARLCAVFAGLLAACGSTETGTDSVSFEPGPFVSPVVDATRKSTSRIGPGGGRVRATGADGTVYALTIPPEALAEEIEISVIPVRSIDDLPMSGGLVGAVHFEPSGLQFLRAATLTVELTDAPALGGDEVLAGFTYDGDGDDLALALVATDTRSFALQIRHFSGAGAGAATPSDLQTSSAPGSANAFVAKLIESVSSGDEAAIASTLRGWYEVRVRPALQAAVSSDAALERGIDELGRWQDAVLMIGSDGVSAFSSESHGLAADAFAEAIVRANDLCERRASFTEAEKALLLQRRAESVLPGDVLLAKSLDRQSVVNELCLQVVFESTSFPQVPVVGEPALLEVVVGFAFGDGPTETSFGMVVNVLTNGAIPAGANEITDQNGRVELTLTPDRPSVDIEVDACIGIGGFASALVGASVCQEAFIVRGLVIDPGDTTVQPGGTIAFAAILGGDPAAVSWTATGGSIDDGGSYTAGSSEGTFRVTATSVDDPSLSATATVRVQASDFDTSQFRGAWFGDLIDENGQSVCAQRGQPEGFENRCVRLDFFFNTDDFARVEGCLVSNEFGACGGTISEWGGAITGNVFTSNGNHRTITFGTTVRHSDHPCAVQLSIETNADGNLQLSGQLKNFMRNTCSSDSTTQFTTLGFVRE